MEEFSEVAREDSSLPRSNDFHSQEQFQSAPSVNYTPFALDLVPTLGDLVPSSSSVSPVDNFVVQTVPVCGIPQAANANADMMTRDAATFRKAPFGCDVNYQYRDEKFGASAYQPAVLRNSVCLQNTNNSNGASLAYGPMQGNVNTAYHQPQITSCQSGGPYPGSILQQIPKAIHQTEMQPRYSTGKRSPERGRKAAKKRKKKGIDEPQRPVSAYALFFRDTQAAIKTENSAATFGEISKIVASMWDNLSEQAKQVYKQKTENAKREYLKHLAAFRANMISKEISSASRLPSSAAQQTEIYVMSKGAQEPKSTSTMAGLPGVSAHLSFPVTHLDGGLTQPLYQDTQAAIQNIPMGNTISSSTLTTPASTAPLGSHFGPGPMATSLILPDMLQTTKGTGDMFLLHEQNNHVNSIIRDLTTTTAAPCTAPLISTGQEIPARYCIRPGCNNLAMAGPYSDSNYCSNDCAYGHIHCS